MPHACRTHVRSTCALGLVLAASAAALAPSASAGVVETPNACKFSYDGEFRTQGVEVTATAPASAAAGQTFTLSGQELEVKLRQQLAEDAAAVGLIPANGQPTTVVTRTWIALRGTNTREGTQVVGPITVNATTTATQDPASTSIDATPWSYTPPKLPDTMWTATRGAIAFSQAGAGAITGARGQLPVGGGGSPMTVGGSAVTQANLPGGANFFMDCQPGITNVQRPEAGAGTTFVAQTAAPFATVGVAGPPSNPGGAPVGPGTTTGAPRAAVTAARPGRVSSTRLSGRGGRIKLRITCAGQRATCRGTVRIRTATPHRIGRARPKLITMARSLKYVAAAGKARTVTLRVGLQAKVLLRRKATQKVTVTLKPAKGKAVTRRLNLRR